MQKHFITGGTGFIGRNLVRALVKKGDRVYLLIRPSSLTSKKYVESIFPDIKNNISVIEGDIIKLNLGISKKNYDNLKKEKVNFVWHLAANLAFNQNLDDKVRFKANTIGTKHVVAFANDLKTILCHCSTAYVCGNSKYFSENTLDTKQSFRNSYERTKFLAEEIVNKEAKGPFIIFRPSLVIDKPVLGKASNCTFGYYRYAYMFFLFKKWVVKSLITGTVSKIFLKVLGAELLKGNKVKFKYLFMPYPDRIYINMVPIDYVVKSLIKVAGNTNAYGKTFHLTHPKPGQFILLMKNVFEDLGIENLHYVAVNPKIFAYGFNILYLFVFPLRGYMKSALKYLPYITTSPKFDRKNINLYSLPPVEISKKYFSEINKEAFNKVFPKI